MVPFKVAVGWEFLVGGRVVVVYKVCFRVIVVRDSAGVIFEYEVVREDIMENTINLQGSFIIEGDTGILGVEIEEEVEVDE